MTEHGALLPDPSPRLEAGYREVQATRMRGVALLNPALEVQAVGFAPWEGHWLGIVLSPWFMNLTLAPGDPAAWQALLPGEKRHYRFPAGEFEFVGASDALLGELQLCSLFSPVLEFADQQSAVITARCALEALMDARHASAD
jgi:[NiFe] hydrogenase assembly HybE family chaperone